MMTSIYCDYSSVDGESLCNFFENFLLDDEDDHNLTSSCNLPRMEKFKSVLPSHFPTCLVNYFPLWSALLFLFPYFMHLYPIVLPFPSPTHTPPPPPLHFRLSFPSISPSSSFPSILFPSSTFPYVSPSLQRHFDPILPYSSPHLHPYQFSSNSHSPGPFLTLPIH